MVSHLPLEASTWAKSPDSQLCNCPKTLDLSSNCGRRKVCRWGEKQAGRSEPSKLLLALGEILAHFSAALSQRVRWIPPPAGGAEVPSPAQLELEDAPRHSCNRDVGTRGYHCTEREIVSLGVRKRVTLISDDQFPRPPFSSRSKQSNFGIVNLGGIWGSPL